MRKRLTEKEKYIEDRGGETRDRNKDREGTKRKGDKKMDTHIKRLFHNALARLTVLLPCSNKMGERSRHNPQPRWRHSLSLLLFLLPSILLQISPWLAPLGTGVNTAHSGNSMTLPISKRRQHLMEVSAEPILNDSWKNTKEPVTVVASGEEDQSSGEGERLFPLFYTLNSILYYFTL